jgi:hypothetical protein
MSKAMLDASVDAGRHGPGMRDKASGAISGSTSAGTTATLGRVPIRG